MDHRMLRYVFITLQLLLAGHAALASSVYLTQDEFLSETFGDKPPEASVIWLTGETRDAVAQILGHVYPTLRIRYWVRDRRSAWILEEVGKEQPITVGIAISDRHIEHIKVLVFRESRGWEIRHSFFTDQFESAQLDGERQLDRRIDGISGATLSVNAMKKLARLALYLDAARRDRDVTPAP
jgi:FMN-binding domain